MKVIGIVLILVGVLSLSYKGITYTQEHKVIDVGPLQASVDQKKTIPISPLLGGLALAAGLVMVLADRRRA